MDDSVTDNPFTQAQRALAHTESHLVNSFAEDARRELAAVDSACVLLLTVLLSVEQQRGSLDLDETGKVAGGDVRLVQLMAQLYIGVRGLRTIRAARAVLGHGYEPEARALDRILVELLAHRRAILADATGNEAVAWLEGRRGRGISARVRDMSPGDLYRNLSQDSHGDPAPVGRLFSAETQAIQIDPRRGFATRASLIMYAGFARDQAVVVANLASFSLGGVDQLDAEIRAAEAALEAESEAQGAVP